MLEKLQKLTRRKKKGFTLIEMIVVIAILAILAALLIPAISKYVKQASDTKNMANARAVYTAAAAYAADEISLHGKVKQYVGSTELEEYFGELSGARIRAELDPSTGAVIWASYMPSGGSEVAYPKGAITSGWKNS